MTRKLVLIGAAALGVAALGAGGVAVAATDGTRSVPGFVAAVLGEDDAPIVGEALDKAVAAAKAHVGDGEVTDTEVEDGADEGAAYEVEILKADGEQVEVSLDRAFKVLGSEVDDDSDEGAAGERDD